MIGLFRASIYYKVDKAKWSGPVRQRWPKKVNNEEKGAYKVLKCSQNEEEGPTNPETNQIES